MLRNRFIIWTVMLTLAAPYLASAEPLKIGVSSSLELKRTYEYYWPLIGYVERQLGNRTELVLRERNKEIVDLLDQGTITMAIVCPRSYIRGRETSGYEILAAPQVNGRPFYYSYVLVRNDSPIQDLAGLRGKRFAFTSPKSLAGELAPFYMIFRRYNKMPENYFSSIQSVRSYEEALYLLANRHVDGVSIDSMAYDYAVRKKLADTSTRIICTSPQYGVPPLVARKGINPGLKEKVKNILLTMHTMPEGKAVLQEMGLDKYIAPKDSIYSAVREIDKWAAKNKI